MKIKIFFVFLLVCIVVLTSQSVAAVSTERQNWYFKSSRDGTQPQLMGSTEQPTQYPLLAMGPKGDKTVYLTFDAGYSNENVEKILDILKKHNAKGAFFILPGIVNNSPSVVKRMHDEGHLICNHSYSHGDMSQIADKESFFEELAKCHAHLKEKLGIEMTRYFRPPEGAFSEQMLEYCEETGYIPVFWSFAHADWDNARQPTAQATEERILSSLHDGMVLLLHPTSKANADALDSVLTEIAARGYAFGTLPELAQKCGIGRER